MEKQKKERKKLHPTISGRFEMVPPHPPGKYSYRGDDVDLTQPQNEQHLRALIDRGFSVLRMKNAPASPPTPPAPPKK